MRDRLLSLPAWAPPLIVIVFVFVTSWPLMLLVEPASNPLTEPENYWWWFIVTAATVGYGDFVPEAAGGHLVGIYVIIGGIATLTTLFTRLAATIETKRGRRMQGALTSNVSDHIVILGYTPEHSERILNALLTEHSRPIVLCAWDKTETHPLPNRNIDFVRGDLTDDSVLKRAGVDRAYSVLVDARDDNEALAIAVSVDYVNPRVHIVVGLRDIGRASHFSYINKEIHCVQWHIPRMASEELQNPGITRVYSELFTHGKGDTYSLQLPNTFAPISFGDCQTALGKKYNATVLAADIKGELLISPPWQAQLIPGAMIYYISQQRITVEQVLRATQELSKSN